MSEAILTTGTFTLPANATWWSCIWGGVSVTNGLTVVTGTAGNWLTKLVAGQSVSFANQNGTVYIIATVDSNTQVTLTTAFTGATNAATAMGFSANPVFRIDGEQRLKGAVFSSLTPAAGQMLQLSQDGTNWDTPIPLIANPGTTDYTFDANIVAQPYQRLIFNDAGAGSTLRVWIYSVSEGSGPSIMGGSTTPPTPNALPSTFRVGFDGIVFGTAGGNFLELSNPAASGRVLRVTLQMLCKPSVPIVWKVRKQSTLDTVGTSTTPTPVSMDSQDSATVGIVKLYTVAPTPGTSLGTIWDQTVTGGDIVEDDPGINVTLTKPVTLRPGESVAWNSSAAFTFQGVIEFTDGSV